MRNFSSAATKEHSGSEFEVGKTAREDSDGLAEAEMEKRKKSMKESERIEKVNTRRE